MVPVLAALTLLGSLLEMQGPRSRPRPVRVRMCTLPGPWVMGMHTEVGRGACSAGAVGSGKTGLVLGFVPASW